MDNKQFRLRPSGAKQPGSRFKNVGFVLLLVLLGLIIFAAFTQPSGLKQVPFSQVVADANSGKIKQIIVNGNELKVTPNGQASPTEESFKEAGSSIYEQGLAQGKVELINKDNSNNSSVWVGLAENVLPVVIIAGVLLLLFRSAQGQGNQALSFGKSRARLYGNEKQKVTFKDIAGDAEAKQDLEEVVEFLKYPQKFASVGARIPKGVLLVGPPGTGKTLLARAVAGEANAPFFSISGSEFVEMFVGVGASRVRDLFSKAKKNAPCIIFIDEIDAVGRKRGSGMGGGHDEREQTLNQILVEMDGFEQGQNVIVLAATNRADVLDPALLRPGRFDRRVNIDLPDRKDRLAILKLHFFEKPMSKSVNLDSLAAKTVGTSGADLANMANEAAIIAARRGRKVIENEDAVEAFEKVALGPERKGKVLTEKDKELAAYHEAGHAVVGHVLPDSDMVHKVTIISRGQSGGVTWFIPPEDRSYKNIIEFKDILARSMGGRMAEELVYGPERVTTGASADLQGAAEIAREMIVKYGMGKKLRNQAFHVDEGMMLDRLVHEREYSDETAKLIDQEVEALVTEASNRAREVIKANMPKLETLKKALLDRESLEADEVEKILGGSTLPKSASLY